jgi:hypothetical protein
MRDVEAIFRDLDDGEIEPVFLPQQRETVGADWPIGSISREVMQEIWAWAWGSPEGETPRSLTTEEAELFAWFATVKENRPHLTTLQLAPGKVVVDPGKFLGRLEAEILRGTESPRMRMGTPASELRELRQAVG